MSLNSFFTIGQHVETNQRFREQAERINEIYCMDRPLYHKGMIVQVDRTKFRDRSIPDIVILTLDTGFKHSESMFSHI